MSPVCRGDDLEQVAHASHACQQVPGELMVVPSAWWHATCQLPHTVAVGGQDACDITFTGCPPAIADAAKYQPVQSPNVCRIAGRSLLCHNFTSSTPREERAAAILQPKRQAVSAAGLERFVPLFALRDGAGE